MGAAVPRAPVCHTTLVERPIWVVTGDRESRRPQGRRQSVSLDRVWGCFRCRRLLTCLSSQIDWTPGSPAKIVAHPPRPGLFPEMVGGLSGRHSGSLPFRGGSSPRMGDLGVQDWEP